MSFGIDLLRHIFSIAVIMQHMGSESRYSVETGQRLGEILNWIDGAVIGFFFISGFLFKNPQDILTYGKRQTRKLMVPFLMFSTLYTILLSLLGKSTIWTGLIATISLHGSGPHLYFLPFLLIVTFTYACLLSMVRSDRVFLANCFLIVLFVTLCLLHPTESSTGPDYKLLPLYYASFILGVEYQSFTRDMRPMYVILFVFGSAISIFLIGTVDHRFFDLLLIFILFEIVRQVGRFFPPMRLPGCGGVYLLHTPVTNYAISVFLMKLSVVEWQNLYFSAGLTYILCCGFTLAMIKIAPRYRWMLLE